MGAATTERPGHNSEETYHQPCRSRSDPTSSRSSRSLPNGTGAPASARCSACPPGTSAAACFACLIEYGIIVRLPNDVAKSEIQGRGAPYRRRGRAMGSWVMYRPRSSAEARRLTPVLEIAARHIAERQVEEMAGVTLRKKR